ncbi:MAG TPA: ABC transporter substrate-binding protein [Bacilli bacterium]
MKLAKYYLQLHSRFPQAAHAQGELVTIDELADLLACTHRNVQLILQRMAERGWIKWEPRRGRGRRSQLLLAAPADRIALDFAKQLVDRHHLRDALEQFNIPEMPQSAGDIFQEWLAGYFGYHPEFKGNKKIDTLRFPVSQPIRTLDPLMTNLSSESHLVNQIFDSLVRYNRKKGVVEPAIAHAWESNQAHTEWTLYLRKGVKFHHGRELSAEDVFFTLERIRTSPAKSLYRKAIVGISTIAILDPVTVRIRLSEPNALFLEYLSVSRASIVPAEIVRTSPATFAKNPIGTGPFRLAEHGEGIWVLEAFEGYFGGRAHLDKVEIWHIPNFSPAEKTDKWERFQIIHSYRLPERVSQTWNEVQEMGTTCKFVTLNVHKDGPLQNAAFRRACCQAINLSRIYARLNDQTVEKADGFLRASNRKQGDHAAQTPQIPANLSALSGNTLVLCTIPQYEHDAVLLKEELRQYGIDLQIDTVDAEEFKGERRLNADLILFALLLDNDLELRLIDLYDSISEHLHARGRDKIDGKLRQIMREPAAELRNRLFVEIEQYMLAQSLICFLYRRRLQAVFHASVKGISLDSLGWLRFKDIWFKTELPCDDDTIRNNPSR